MYYNLKAIEEFGFFGDIKIMIMTVLAVLGVDFKDSSKQGTNYLETAAMADNPEAVRYLISKGLRVNNLNRISIGSYNERNFIEDEQKTRSMRELIKTLQSD
jgi:ankyrin repeat protein